MKTELLYLEDTYLFKSTARFLELRENEKGKAVILDQTIFYPQGGGQPSDVGYIETDNALFRVTFVGLDPEGTVWHFGEFEKGSFQIGDEVSLCIDEEKRRLHARIHSAGHLLDCAIADLGVNVVPGKGFHFVEGPYIECDGVVENPDSFKAELEKRVNEIISQGIELKKEVLDEGEAKERGLVAPPGKGVRIVGFGGYKPCGCGGTHVSNSADIKGVTVRKVSSKKGKTKISYSVV